MCVDLIGYSERGMVNAICDDLVRGGCQAVCKFLSWFSFPFQQRLNREDICTVTLLVEQSFSDFGDLDLLVMLDHKNGDKQAILIEAKVSNDTNSWLTVDDRWEEFLRLLDGGEGSTSNLFVQLHRKVRLATRLHPNGEFIPDRFTPRGSLGENQVVKRAADKLRPYVKNGLVWYGAILPDEGGSLATFFEHTLPVANLQDTLPAWDTAHWGFLSWRTIWDVVHDKDAWQRTDATLQWNQGQIFRKEPPQERLIECGQRYSVGGHPVFVVNAGRRVCRIVRLNGENQGFFWRTESIIAGELTEPWNDGGDLAAPFLPHSGATYQWHPQQDAERLPAQNGVPQIDPDAQVTVVGRPSWWKTRVRIANAEPNDPTTFLVYTHHLRRPV
jgi:hypothetical protein